MLRAEQTRGYDSNRLTTSLQHCFGHRTHHSLAATAVDQPMTGLYQTTTQLTGSGNVFGSGPGSGTTECAKTLHTGRAAQSDFFKVSESEFRQ